MKKQEFRGKTLDEALELASQTLGVPKNSVGYSILPVEGGLLSRLFSKVVRIEAWRDEQSDLQEAAREAVRSVMKSQSVSRRSTPSQPNQKASQNTPAETIPTKRKDPEKRKTAAKQATREPVHKSPRRPAGRNRDEALESRLPLTTGPTATIPEQPQIRPNHPDVVKLLGEFTSRVLDCYLIDPIDFENDFDEIGNCTININNSYLEEILAKSDRLSMALEHVFKRIAQKSVGDVGGRIVFTAGMAHQTREDNLKALALSYADKVRSSGRLMTVPSKTPQERRLIHMAIDGLPGVATRSSGAGDRRRLIIYPIDANGKEIESAYGRPGGESRNPRRRRESPPDGAGSNTRGRRRNRRRNPSSGNRHASDGVASVVDAAQSTDDDSQNL